MIGGLERFNLIGWHKDKMMEESSDESAEIITKEEADLARKMQDADISRKYYRSLKWGGGCEHIQTWNKTI